jgi:hypothetical protein
METCSADLITVFQYIKVKIKEERSLLKKVQQSNHDLNTMEIFPSAKGQANGLHTLVKLSMVAEQACFRINECGKSYS